MIDTNTTKLFFCTSNALVAKSCQTSLYLVLKAKFQVHKWLFFFCANCGASCGEKRKCCHLKFSYLCHFTGPLRAWLLFFTSYTSACLSISTPQIPSCFLKRYSHWFIYPQSLFMTKLYICIIFGEYGFYKYNHVTNFLGVYSVSCTSSDIPYLIAISCSQFHMNLLLKCIYKTFSKSTVYNWRSTHGKWLRKLALCWWQM